MRGSATRGSAMLGRTLSIFLGLLLSTASARAADGTWTNWTAGGPWSTASNWQALTIPDAGTAYLTNSAGSYVVGYDAVSPAIKNLNVWNVTPKTTGLTISAPLTHLGGSALRIGAGARVAVTNGGVWTYTGTNSATDSSTPMLLVERDGRLDVNGGTMLFTNLQRTASYRNFIYVGHQSTGTLHVASGRLEFWGLSPATANDSHGLAVGRQSGGFGTMEISGGTVVLGNPAAGNSTLTIGTGAPGTVTVSGGALLFTNSVWNAVSLGSVSGVAGSGTLIVSNNAVVHGPNIRASIGDGANCRGVARLAGGTTKFSTTYIGNINAAGTVTGLLEVAGGTLDNVADMYVCYPQGGGAARGTLAISAGSVTVGSSLGLAVGQARTGHTGVGDLSMSGGTLRVNNGVNYKSGLLIGYIPESDASAATRATGTATISGGAITNNGMVVVGYNGATGTVMQTSGSVVVLTSVANLTAIGYGTGASSYFKGGYGTYTMQGGTYLTRSRTFVGGVPTSVVSDANNASVGVLEVTGGTFTCSNTMYVAANGTGTLTVGNGGRVDCDDLQIANSTSGTLRFNVLPSWSGLVKVKNTVTIAAGAKLVIDLTDYVPEAPTAVHLLLDATARSGSFAAGDITWINPSEHLTELEQLADGDLRLTVQDPRGTVILLR